MCIVQVHSLQIPANAIKQITQRPHYKNFLRSWLISHVCKLGIVKHFHSSLIFAAKAGAYPSGDP